MEKNLLKFATGIGCLLVLVSARVAFSDCHPGMLTKSSSRWGRPYRGAERMIIPAKLESVLNGTRSLPHATPIQILGKVRNGQNYGYQVNVTFPDIAAPVLDGNGSITACQLIPGSRDQGIIWNLTSYTSDGYPENLPFPLECDDRI